MHAYLCLKLVRKECSAADSWKFPCTGLVKLLRKCYTQLMSKTQVLMQAGATAEREARLQVSSCTAMPVAGPQSTMPVDPCLAWVDAVHVHQATASAASVLVDTISFISGKACGSLCTAAQASIKLCPGMLRSNSICSRQHVGIASLIYGRDKLGACTSPPESSCSECRVSILRMH